MLPTFLVIGAQKAATTSLWAGLRQHPDVFVPETKELDYFTTAASFARRDWYEQQFAGAGRAVARGEASTTYTFFPHHGGVPARIAEVVPDMRLVYVVREPVERMGSAFGHATSTGVETRPIDAALTTDLRYLAPSLYAMQLEQYRRHFPDRQLLVVTHDAIGRDSAGVLHRVCDFIGVRPPAPGEIEVPRLNTSEERRSGSGQRRAAHRPGGLAAGFPAAARRPLLGRVLRHAPAELTAELRDRLADVIRPDLHRFAELVDDEARADVVGWPTYRTGR